MENPEDAADVIKEYEEIIRTKRKGIISIAYHQGKVISRFRENEKFMGLVTRFGIHKNTIIFKINILKLIDKHPELMQSSTTFSFLKNYLKDTHNYVKKDVFFAQQSRAFACKGCFRFVVYWLFFIFC